MRVSAAAAGVWKREEMALDGCGHEGRCPIQAGQRHCVSNSGLPSGDAVTAWVVLLKGGLGKSLEWSAAVFSAV